MQIRERSRVEEGEPGTTTHYTGTVVELIEGDTDSPFGRYGLALVAWDTGVRTYSPVRDLRAI